MVYQQYETDSSTSSGSRASSSDSSYSGSEGRLSLKYADDDGTYSSEHDRELEEIDVHSPRQYRSGKGDLELFEDEGIRGARDDETEYSDHDIRKPKKSVGFAYYLNAVRTYDYKGAVNKGVDAVLDFDWSTLREKKNMLKILYFVLGFIAFVLIIHLPVAKAKRNAALAAATAAPSIEITNAYTETYTGTGTYAPSSLWGQYEGTYETSTWYPTAPWWAKKHKPWYEGSWEPTVWSSTDAPMSEEEKAALLEAALEAEKAAQEAEDAAKAAEEAVEAAGLNQPGRPIMPGFARPGGSIPTNAPTLAPTASPPTEAPTTGEPTTAAPIAWYVNWEGTWAPTLWSETSTWAPTTWMPTSMDVAGNATAVQAQQNATGVQGEVQGQVVDVETLGDGN